MSDMPGVTVDGWAAVNRQRRLIRGKPGWGWTLGEVLTFKTPEEAAATQGAVAVVRVRVRYEVVGMREPRKWYWPPAVST